MTRAVLFDREPSTVHGGLSGLAGLTAPGPDDGVSRVVDAVVLGAKGDGKTQLITHAIRTLDARPATGLSPDEQLQNDKILQLVLNAKRPLPEANPDRKVRHYVFRVRAENILNGLAPLSRVATLLRAGAGGRYLGLAGLSALLTAGVLMLLRGALDAGALAGAAVALVAGVAWALRAARRDLVAHGDVEMVLWDVAGEDVYSDRGAGGYHAFLSALVARRRQQPGPAYSLAPVLICNPLALGRSGADSPYARLRMILPTFAALQQPPADVLVVVNRSQLAAAICAPAREAGELLAVLPIARDAPPAVDGGGPRDPLPVVRRDVVLGHCYDGEPTVARATHFHTIRYDAGLDAEASESEWRGFAELAPDARARWRDPDEPSIARLIEYRYAEGPGALSGEAARGFYAWVARALWRRGQAAATPAPVSRPLGEQAPAAQSPLPPEAHGTAKMYASALSAPEPQVDERGAFRSGT